MTDRLQKIEETLEEHGVSILELQDSTRRLEAGQERQSVAIQELSSGFGRVLGELGKIGESQKDMLGTMRNMSDAVVRIDTNQNAFRREWSGVCDGKHKHIEYRLDRVEAGNEQVIKEVDNMSDESKVRYIENLEAKLLEHAKAEAQKSAQKANVEIQKAKDDAEEKRAVKVEKIRLIGILIGGLLTGGLGAVFFRWLFGV